MNDAYQRPGRFKLLYFAVLIFYGSTYSWSSGESTETTDEKRDSTVEENPTYATYVERSLSPNAKTVPNQDESDPSTKHQELNPHHAYHKHDHKRTQQQEILVSSSVSRQDFRQDSKTSGRSRFIVIYRMTNFVKS